MGNPSASTIPGARFEPASWTDSAGNFWLFGGNGFDAVGNESPMNDLWKYSNGQWTWVAGSSVGRQNGNYGSLGVASATNHPGGRSGAMTWIDASGNLWLFGGLGYDESNPINDVLSDLWKYSNGQWTWMGGPKIKQQSGIYGTKGLASPTNNPGARWGAFNWKDSAGNLWLFGGSGYDANGSVQVLNDLWEYSNGEWIWMGGSNVIAQPGIYGTKGTPSPNNIPGARWAGATWTDPSGDVWLFGGNGFVSNVSAGWLNDLWKFSNGQWTWMGGSNVVNQSSSYGTQGSLGVGNAPGGRFFLNRWVDANGNLWLFGGYGQIPGNTGNLNDLWMYMP
jgi:N-acetylneuraminic acid mutarotase